MFLVRPSRKAPINLEEKLDELSLQAEVEEGEIDAFEKYGFYINENGQIMDIKSTQSWKDISSKFAGSAFKFTKDMERNQVIYEALADSLQLRVEKELKELGLNEFKFPILKKHLDVEDKFNKGLEEDKLSKMYWRIMATPNAFKSAKRVVVLVPNYNLRPWCWSARLTFNKSYKEGSFLIYAKKFVELGYEVILSNVNENDFLDGKPIFQDRKNISTSVPLPGHKNIEQHIRTLFEDVIFPSDPEKVFVITHRYGGHALIHAIQHNFNQFEKKVQAISFLHSIHSSNTLIESAAKEWLIGTAIHWVENKNVEVGEPVPDLRFGCTVLSAGGSDDDHIFNELLTQITLFFNSR